MSDGSVETSDPGTDLGYKQTRTDVLTWLLPGSYLATVVTYL